MRDNEQGAGDGTASRIHGDLFGGEWRQLLFYVTRLFIPSFPLFTLRRGGREIRAE